METANNEPPNEKNIICNHAQFLQIDFQVSQKKGK